MPKASTKTKRSTAEAKTTRKKKDPNAPKRGLSAYMFFANENRENVREENPGISFGHIGKVLGERWKALEDSERAPYDAKAAADKKRYDDEKRQFNTDTQSQADSEAKLEAKRRKYDDDEDEEEEEDEYEEERNRD